MNFLLAILATFVLAATQAFGSGEPMTTSAFIAANAFGTRLWENLPTGDKRWLLATLRAKRKEFNAPACPA